MAVTVRGVPTEEHILAREPLRRLSQGNDQNQRQRTQNCVLTHVVVPVNWGSHQLASSKVRLGRRDVGSVSDLLSDPQFRFDQSPAKGRYSPLPRGCLAPSDGAPVGGENPEREKGATEQRLAIGCPLHRRARDTVHCIFGGVFQTHQIGLTTLGRPDHPAHFSSALTKSAAFIATEIALGTLARCRMMLRPSLCSETTPNLVTIVSCLRS